MNKKFITILLIIGMLTAGLGLVSANETLTDGSASTVNEDNAENDISQASETGAQANDDAVTTEITNETNGTETNETNGTETNETEVIEEEYDLTQIGELISTMDDSELDALVYYLDVNGVNGEYDDIIAILSSENYDVNELIDAMDALDDESFLTFVDVLNMVLEDSTIVSSAKPVKNTPTAKNPVNTILEKTGATNVINNVANVFYPKNSNNIPFVHGPDELSIIYDILNEYFEGSITFDELLDQLEYWGIDPTSVTENEDGSLTIDGKIITSAQDFIDAINEEEDATDSSVNDTVANETANDTADTSDEVQGDSAEDTTTDSDNQTSDNSNSTE